MVDTWFVLHHTPGPAIPEGGTVFAHPGFGDHVAFLQRMHDAGHLIAAGPLGDAGDGMTVLDVESQEEAERLATQDDQSVVAGVLAVVVSVWHVRMRR